MERYADQGLPFPAIHSQPEWHEWIRAQDSDVRSRIDRGTEDSISNFLLYGTSFTKLARLDGSDDALNVAGSVSSDAAARIHDLILALDSHRPGERLQFIRQFLARRSVSNQQIEGLLTANLVRFAKEQHAYQQKLADAAQSRDTNQIMAVRGTLYENRGLSADTSLLPNFAIEETLGAMIQKGALRPDTIRRIAIVGPGLDFTDKRDGYDFYPLQTVQPFAILEAVERLGLAAPGEVRVFTLDLNSAVNAHIARASARCRRGLNYTLQLPRDTRNGWSEAAVSYWRRFGTILGTSSKPLPVPEALPTIESRAVSIPAKFCSTLTPIDLNVVAQTLDFPDGDGFDLVVATNILVYYDAFQQSLAMSNIAHMMNRSGIFLANNALPTAHDRRLKYLGLKNVPFDQDASYGDDIVVYQRQ